ncbi:MAG: OmpA family protein, partial [Leadbetterella sp.]
CFLKFGAFAQDKKVLMLFERGKSDFNARNYSSASDNFTEYLKKDSTRTEAYFKLGQINETLRNSEKAIFYYQKFISKDTTKSPYIQAYTYLGTRALEKGQFQDAKYYLQISQKYTNKNSIIYQQILRQLKTSDFAISALQDPILIQPEPLPKVINFKNKQYFPVLTADNATIIYTARNEGENENIYISKIDNTDWSTPSPISDKINSSFNEGTCSISADGKIMVFTSCEGRQSYGSCDLYISRLENNIWSEPENIGLNVNSNYWDSQPSLSPDGSRLYFSSERPFGQGKKDIWMSELDANGKWKRAINLGKEINTPYDEVSPFLHANGSTLFFSSNGREGMGKFDIFMCNHKNMQLSESVNLGYPINTIDDEISLFVTANGKKAYYSVEKNNEVNLYSFTIPDKLAQKFNKTIYIKGYVLEDKTQKPLYASLELLDQKSGEKLSRFHSDPITGDYMAVLPGDGSYVLYVETEDHFYKSIKFDFKEKHDEKKLDIFLNKIEKQSIVRLDNIYFGSGSAALTEESNIELKKLHELLALNKTLKVEISAHTDDVGNDAANLELSKKRAKSVVDFLNKLGIAPDRIVSVGYGETKPQVKNISEENRQINRRIEMKFL